MKRVLLDTKAGSDWIKYVNGESTEAEEWFGKPASEAGRMPRAEALAEPTAVTLPPKGER
jgi:hypothetical protein